MSTATPAAMSTSPTLKTLASTNHSGTANTSPRNHSRVPSPIRAELFAVSPAYRAPARSRALRLAGM
jgi:hypothetical protein